MHITFYPNTNLLSGYGRSAKPTMPYSQYAWAQFCSDFIRQIVKRPVVLAGNSIGGFISTTVCASLTNEMVKGVILLNSAGRVDGGFSKLVRSNPAELDKLRKKPSPPIFVVELASRGLFAFLQGSVKKQLARLYPTAPQNADDWLADEISRASGDPGAIGVFRSAFFLPSPVPITYNLEAFNGPTLVLQGVLDPLNDAKTRANEIEQNTDLPSSLFKVVRLQLGHCPMDENADMVNKEMLQFLQNEVASFTAGKVGSARQTAVKAQ